jgi:hypothetical protein
VSPPTASPPAPTHQALATPDNRAPHPDLRSSQDEHLLDYDSTTPPRSRTTPCHTQEKDNDIVGRQLSYREVLSSPPILPRRPTASAMESCHSVGVPPPPQKPKLLSILVHPKGVTKQPPSRTCDGRPGPSPMKSLRSEAASSKEEAATATHSGWQTVRHRKWRPKLPARQDHEHQQTPTRIGQRATEQLRQHGSRSWADTFKKKTTDHCFRCLASDHRVVVCRDLARCILCLKTGLLGRHFRHPAPKSVATTRPTLSSTIQATSDPSGRVVSMAGHHLSITDQATSDPCIDKVEACVTFTPTMLAIENDYHSRGLIIVLV